MARDRNFASWTKTTSGFGLKMLEKMGWSKGKGLGVQEQGIARPIDVKLRQKGAGLQDAGERTEQSRQVRDSHGHAHTQTLATLWTYARKTSWDQNTGHA